MPRIAALADPSAFARWSATPNLARVASYFHGGEDYFEVDRNFATNLDWIDGDYGRTLCEERAFRTRAVKHLVGVEGVTQIVDLGAGFPDAERSQEPNNIHKIAQLLRPGATTVYVDSDPVVAMYLDSGLARDHTTAVHADVCDTAALLAHLRKSVDFAQPVAVMLVGLLEYLTDDQAQDVLTAFADAMASGFVVISYAGWSLSRVADYVCTELDVTMTVRRPRELKALLPSRLSLLPPGIVPCSAWGNAIPTPKVGQYCAVARVS